MAVAITINEDLWAEPIVDIYQLQAKDFTKWVRKFVRENGRKSEICSQRNNAIEVWLQELGIVKVGFLSGGEIWSDATNELLGISDWDACGMYMFNDDGFMETKAGRWLDIINDVSPEAYLIG